MDARQLKEVVIVPALTALGLNTPSAVNLLLGTAAVESQMGKYIKQIKGPALGIYQMEPRTYLDLWLRLIMPKVALRAKVKLLLGYEGKPPADRLTSDLMLATVMTRLHYFAVPQALPDKDDIMGLGTYWKNFYNSAHGAGTVEGFTDAYYRHVKQSV